MNDDISKLSSENCSLYYKMTKYLSEKRLKKSEYLRVCEDIVLMLSDAQSRGETAENLFPDGYENFLDAVAENCAKEKWYTTFLGVLFCALAVFSAVVLVEVLFTKLWANEGEWVSGVNIRINLGGFLSSFLAGGVGVAVSILSSKFAFKKFIYDNKLGFYFYAILIIAVAIGIAVLLDVLIKDTLITFNWVALACPVAGAAVIIKLLQYFISKK